MPASYYDPYLRLFTSSGNNYRAHRPAHRKGWAHENVLPKSALLISTHVHAPSVHERFYGHHALAEGGGCSLTEASYLLASKNSSSV